MGEKDLTRRPPKPRKALEAKEIEIALLPWFRQRLVGATLVEFSEITIPVSTSYSSQIALVRVQWRTQEGTHSGRRVIRLPPPEETALFFRADFERDYRIADALHKTGRIRVPKPLWFEKRADILGAPFAVTEYVEGRPVPDNPPYNVSGWVADADPQTRCALWWSGIEAMTDLHRLDWEAAGLGFLRRASNPTEELQRELDYYASYYDWACQGQRWDVVDRARQWLLANLPEVRELCFCWGDARMGNILYSGDRCNALLDWEMASLGEAEKDLVYWICFDRFNREGVGAPPREGWPSYKETLERYESLLGRPLRNLEYYKIFALYRLTVILTRLTHLWAKTAENMEGHRLLRSHFLPKWLEQEIAHS